MDAGHSDIVVARDVGARQRGRNRCFFRDRDVARSRCDHGNVSHCDDGLRRCPGDAGVFIMFRGWQCFAERRQLSRVDARDEQPSGAFVDSPRDLRHLRGRLPRRINDFREAIAKRTVVVDGREPQLVEWRRFEARGGIGWGERAVVDAGEQFKEFFAVHPSIVTAIGRGS